MRYVKWQKKKLLFWFSCSAALHQVCRGIANPILFRHPDLNSTEVTSATQQSFVGFPFDLGHVEAPGPHTQLKTWGRSTTTQCQAHSLFPFLWKEMTGIWLSPLLIPEVGEINPRVKAWHLPQLCFLTWCLWVLAASSEKTRRNSLLFFFFLLLFLFHTFIFVLSIKTPWRWNTLQKHPLMPRKRSTFYLSQQLAYLVDCQGDRAHGLQLLEAPLHHPALPPSAWGCQGLCWTHLKWGLSSQECPSLWSSRSHPVGSWQIGYSTSFTDPSQGPFPISF